jgi:hypothetical protein
MPPPFTLVSCSAYFFDPEDGGDIFLRNVGTLQYIMSLGVGSMAVKVVNVVNF